MTEYMLVLGGIVILSFLLAYIIGFKRIYYDFLKWQFLHKADYIAQTPHYINTEWTKRGENPIIPDGLRWDELKCYLTETRDDISKYVAFPTRVGEDKIRVWLMGQDEHTKQLFTLRCPPSYYNQSIKECLLWNMNIRDKTKELIER